MLISFSVQVPPAATLFLFGFGIDHPCVRRRIKLEVWTSHVSVHNRILLDLLVLMVSLFFVLLNIGAWWTNWWANPSQLAALQWFYVLMTGMWTCSISEAYFHRESGSEMLLRKMARESSAAPYIPYSGQYRHTISQLRLIPDAHPVPMKWVWPPDSSDTFRSCSNFWL